MDSITSRFQRRASDNSDSGISSTRASDRSSRSTVPSSLPSLEHHDRCGDSPAESEIFEYPQGYEEPGPRDSLNTYCSTAPSFDDIVDDSNHPCYDPYLKEPAHVEAVPATPAEFAELFPTTRCLKIKHDDSTLDGNMNVRVDVNAAAKGEKDKRITLFHLRMYDLRDRDFSLRRYGRDCGREVAHIKRKVNKVTPTRPTLQRSVSRALHSFRGRSEAEQQFKFTRQDSGYSSSGFDDDDDESASQKPESQASTNTCTLEFSNYAHVDLSRRGGKTSKKYDFEYWGKSYSWKRMIRKVGTDEETSFQLISNATNNVVAFIIPDPLTPAQAAAEEAKGGFVPPSSFWLRDSTQDPVISGLADVADVIIATGLTAMVDDCIKRKFHKKKYVQLTLPMPMAKAPLKMNMEYVGPKRLIDEVFNRRPLLPRSQSAPTSSDTHY